MGLLTIDHSGLDKKPGTKWGLHEMRTTSCVHCQGMIVTFQRGCTQYTISGMDVFETVLVAHELPSAAVEAHGCQKCGKLICTRCAFLMSVNGCPGPAEAQAERLLKTNQ